jgi:membrane-associated phospholipid phosphatase
MGRAVRRWQLAEDALISLGPKKARRGSTWFGRMGDVAQQPPVWAGVAAALALGGGDRGRRAALRASVCYGVTAVVANLIVKPLVARSRPPGAGEDRAGPVTSSFPSGHAATDLAFTFAAAQEIPVLFLVLAPATLAAHWSVVRSRGHYPSDVLVGGLLAVAVALVAWKVWPPGARENDEQRTDASRPDTSEETS